MKDGFFEMSPLHFRLMITMAIQCGDAKKFEVVGHSMEPAIKKGAIIEVEKEYGEIKVYDIITFINRDHLTTHRVKEIKYSSSGVEFYITEGDLPNSGREVVYKEDIVGKVVKINNNFVKGRDENVL